LAIKEKALGGDHPSTATSLNNLAGLYESMGRFADALPLLRRALRIVSVSDVTDRSREHGAIEHLAKMSANLAGFLDKHGGEAATDEAIFYYKLSVNTRQRLRAGAKGLDQATRDSLTRQLADPYYELAKLLVRRGRLAESERVLFLLKESELHGYLRRNGAAAGELAALSWTPTEEAYQRALDEVARLWRAFEQKRAEVLERVRQGRLARDAAEVLALEAEPSQLDNRTGNLMNDAVTHFTEASRKLWEARQQGFELTRTALADKLAEIAKHTPAVTAGCNLIQHAD
ncbi:MAG: hypothetical protein RL671_1622, partial [Pseudomonadota bacterium]